MTRVSQLRGRLLRGVAIAPHATSLADITPAYLAGLDFTSRSRTPHEGQVVIFENTAARFLAVQVVEVQATGHGYDADLLVIKWSVVPTDDSAAQAAEIVQLASL